MVKNKFAYLGSVLVILIAGASCPRVARGQAESLPARFDWAGLRIMTSVKDQGDFGTCWAFASVGLLEALIKKETGLDVDLSEQYLISNIDGVSPFLAMEFLETRGVVRESRLPYRGDTSSVNTDLAGEFFLGGHSVTNVHDKSLVERIATIKRIVYEYGPVVTTMNLMDDFRYYQTGIYVYDGQSQEQPGGHIILITGWVDDSAVLNGGYWIIKNSAGIQWGEGGFGKVAYGQVGIDDYYVIHGILERSETR